MNDIEARLTALERLIGELARRVDELDHRTIGSMVIGGNRPAGENNQHRQRVLEALLAEGRENG